MFRGSVEKAVLAEHLPCHCRSGIYFTQATAGLPDNSECTPQLVEDGWKPLAYTVCVASMTHACMRRLLLVPSEAEHTTLFTRF